jgi:hypothetical protein
MPEVVFSALISAPLRLCGDYTTPECDYFALPAFSSTLRAR